MPKADGRADESERVAARIVARAMPRARHLIMVGNPAVGKSTLLNSLCGEGAFDSGVSYGSGLTSVLETRTVAGMTYVDTPGLNDVERRKQAAVEIKRALQHDGLYQVVFVARLDMGRVRAEDVATIKLILDASKDLGHSLVLNLLEETEVQGLQEQASQALKKVVQMMNKGLGLHTIVMNNVFLMPRRNDLAGMPNQFMNLPKDHPFRTFIERVPIYDISPPSVNEIKYERFEEEAARLEEQMRGLLKQCAEKDRVIERTRAHVQWSEVALKGVQCLAAVGVAVAGVLVATSQLDLGHDSDSDSE